MFESDLCTLSNGNIFTFCVTAGKAFRNVLSFLWKCLKEGLLTCCSLIVSSDIFSCFDLNLMQKLDGTLVSGLVSSSSLSTRLWMNSETKDQWSVHKICM